MVVVVIVLVIGFNEIVVASCETNGRGPSGEPTNKIIFSKSLPGFSVISDSQYFL